MNSAHLYEYHDTVELLEDVTTNIEELHKGEQYLVAYEQLYGDTTVTVDTHQPDIDFPPNQAELPNELVKFVKNASGGTVIPDYEEPDMEPVPPEDDINLNPEPEPVPDTELPPAEEPIIVEAPINDPEQEYPAKAPDESEEL